MRKLIAIVMIMVMVPSVTFARGGALGALLATSTMVGVGVGITSAHYDAWLKRELKGWYRPGIESSVTLDETNGITSEVRLLGRRRVNYVFVGLGNSRSKSVMIKHNRISVTFENGKRRFASVATTVSHIEIKPNWNGSFLLPMPHKNDYKGQNVIVVRIPVYDTESSKELFVIESKMIRDKSIPMNSDTYTHGTFFGMQMEYGANLLSLGDSDNLFKSGKGIFSWSFHFFPWIGHGFDMGMHRIDMREDRNNEILANYPTHSSMKISAYEVYMGYLYRGYLSSKWFFDYGVGFLRTSIENSKISDKNSCEISSASGYYQKLSGYYTFYRNEFPPWIGDFSAGATLYHKYISDGDVYGIHYGGHRFALSFGISVDL